MRRRRAGTPHRKRPRRLGARRDVAHRLVAGLVAQPRRHGHRSGRRVGGHLQDHADGELPLEDAQRLRCSALHEIGRLREDDFGNGDAGRQRGIPIRRHAEHHRNQHRVARLVRVHVQPLRQAHLQGDSNLRAGRDGCGFDERCQLGPARTALRGGVCVEGADDGRGEKGDAELQVKSHNSHATRQSQPPVAGSGRTDDLRLMTCDYFTSLSLITPGAGGSDDSSTEPFTGGRSW